MRLDRKQSFLLLIDIQARLAPAIHGSENVISRCIALVRTARLLGVPIFATEHCPERIGSIVPELRTLITGNEIMGKRHFSCADEPLVLAALKRLDRNQVVIAGMEAHVCAMQAALGLAEHGFTPCFVSDASGSRHPADHATAICRISAERITVASTEMVMFEWLGHADDAAFRKVLGMVKSI